MKADLHIHTNYSDGSFSVLEVTQMARKAGLEVMAISDHDLFTGSIEAKKYEDESLRVITAVELSTEYKGESIHILGYFHNIRDSEGFDNFLKKQRSSRLERAYIIKDRLKEHFQIELKMENLLTVPSITRGTIAEEIIKQGYPYGKKEIFTKMIGNDCPAYYPSTKINPKFGIKMIHEHGGLAILAHPILVKNSPIKEIIEFGVDGIEAIYPANTIEDEAYLRKLAREYQMIITGGSDFHILDDYKHGNIGEYYLEGRELEIFLDKLKDV
ncbi:MAG: PHP domain-containing protein, partial [Bacilli bacterium]|nr:PHP domain-containing protein [Bacilli bacterium]